MDWAKLVIGLIVVTAWIVNAIKERAKAAQQMKPPPPLPSPDVAPAPLAKPAADVQEYLREIRRRKRAAETGRREPEPIVPVAERPRREPVEPVRQAEPVEPARRAEPPTALANPPLDVPAQAHQLTRTELNAAANNIPAVVARRPVTPAARDVFALLRNRRTLASAFVLREILDEPLCKRRRRRR